MFASGSANHAMYMVNSSQQLCTPSTITPHSVHHPSHCGYLHSEPIDLDEEIGQIIDSMRRFRQG
jgi:hypothetical protein